MLSNPKHYLLVFVRNLRTPAAGFLKILSVESRTEWRDILIWILYSGGKNLYSLNFSKDFTSCNTDPKLHHIPKGLKYLNILTLSCPIHSPLFFVCHVSLSTWTTGVLFPQSGVTFGLAQLHSVKHGCLRAVCVAAVFTLSGSLMAVVQVCCRFKYFSYVCWKGWTCSVPEGGVLVFAMFSQLLPFLSFSYFPSQFLQHQSDFCLWHKAALCKSLLLNYTCFTSLNLMHFILFLCKTFF